MNSRSSSGALSEAAAQLLIGGRVLQGVVRRFAEHEGSCPRPGMRDRDGAHMPLQIRAAVLPLCVELRAAVREAEPPPYLGGALKPA